MGKGMVRLVAAAAVIMAVLIVAGTATLVTVVIRRSAAPVGAAEQSSGPTVLAEPAGTRIAGVSGAADGLVLLLQGGGPDRVIVLDGRTGRVAGRVQLAH